jgi:monofunctional biosynthetic peptidoglycan transglycosylase
VCGLAIAGILLFAWVLALRWLDPPLTAFMLGARFNAWQRGEQGFETDHRWVDFEDVSPHVALAVIAAEDQRFPVHTGFDLESIRAALRDNADRSTPRGASTITQQVAKNLFLWPGRSYLRKALEAGLTLWMEWLWPKRRILEIYLNVAEFGRGIYGVEAAAQRYFRRPAKRLDASQSALLAAVLPSPRRLHVDAPTPYVLSRRDWILEQMAGLGGSFYLERLDDP